MANTFTTPYPQTIVDCTGQILPADTTSKKTIVTAGANGGIWKSQGISSTDTSNRTIQFWKNAGGAGTDLLLGTIIVTAGAGNDGTTAMFDMLRNAGIPFFEYDAFGNKAPYLAASTVIKANSTGTITAAKEVDFPGSLLNY
jgi:hypothetical protein